MNIKEMKTILEGLPDEMPLVMVQGQESERASRLYWTGQVMYVPSSRWGGFIFSRQEADTLGPDAVLALMLRASEAL